MKASVTRLQGINIGDLPAARQEIAELHRQQVTASTPGLEDRLVRMAGVAIEKYADDPIEE